MKIDYNQFGGFEIEAENGMDRLWLRAMVENIPKEYKPFLSNFFRVDMEEMCVSKEKYDDGSSIPMTDCDLEETVEDDSDNENQSCWGGIEKIEFDPFGYYCEGLEERIKKAL